MYKKEKKIISTVSELSNYIEEQDIYNSELLYKLGDPSLPRETYEITVYEKRPDLIARDFYGSESYLGILMYQVKTGLVSLVRGKVLKLITKAKIDEIIKNM